MELKYSSFSFLLTFANQDTLIPFLPAKLKISCHFILRMEDLIIAQTITWYLGTKEQMRLVKLKVSQYLSELLER